jgi:glycosyltransferase involved in cell wall biosynthesis
MKIIAITIGSYPEGEATTNRNLALLRGLHEYGNTVDLIVLCLSRKKAAAYISKDGVKDGVKFEYINTKLTPPKNIFYFIWIILFALIKSIIKIIKYNNKNRIDGIILFLTEPLILLPYIILCKILKIKIFHEQTETPEILFNQNQIFGKFRYFFYFFLMRKIDGIFVISNYLKELYVKYTKESKVIVINMVVDYNRFNIVEKSPFEFKYFAYCGTMYGDKDGIDYLIDSFHLIRNKTNIKLVLIGDYTDNRSSYVLEKIKHYGLEEKICLTGSINSKEIPRYLYNAEILLLARPDNLQAHGGFPTKLGEYLLTRKPVLITPVGDIRRFFEDGKNIFFATPNNSKEFANRILYIIENYEIALLVAKNGKKTALENFNYLIEAKKIISFMEQLNVGNC